MDLLCSVCVVVVLELLVTLGTAHSFLSVPEPFSNVETCRIGGPRGFEADCPGPCPNYDFRADKTPDMPSRTWKRGERVEVRWTKNNHLDGFTRLSLVPIDEMWNKDAHHKHAFYFGCWSDQKFECNDFERHRDCYYDQENLAYKTQVTVPTVYPDGVYVLGWVWYGGGRDFGSFGDYYDCAYVEIKGGPLEDTFPAAFEAEKGSCMSSSDHVGECATEPCHPDNWSKRTIPGEFRDGAPILHKWWYNDAMKRQDNQVHVSRHDDFGISGLKIIDSVHEHERHDNQNWVIYLGSHEKITLIPKTWGHVTKVMWYVNGKHYSTANQWPFPIAGHRKRGDHIDYYDWHCHYYDTRVYVTAVVYNGDRRAYYSHDFAFLPKQR